MPLLRLAVVASRGPAAAGGLSAYARRTLGAVSAEFDSVYTARLVDSDFPILDYAAREPESRQLIQGLTVHTVSPAPAAIPALKIASQAVHYRPLERMVAATGAWAWKRSLASAMGADLANIHVIGCGRELIGYTALAHARRYGLGFTIAPAVHIGTWGDSPIDIRLYREADGVIVFTPAEADFLESQGISRSRLFICGLGPDCQMNGDRNGFRDQHRLGDRPTVLFLGRKARGKGFHDLARAFVRVKQTVPDALLISIGADAEPPYPDWPPDSYLDLGSASEQAKADALAACDVMCLPSDGESFGIAYVEAWAYERPVVALDTPASRSLIEDGANGLLVSDRDRDLSTKLIALLTDEALRARLGQAGAEELAQKYSWQQAGVVHSQAFAAARAIASSSPRRSVLAGH